MNDNALTPADPMLPLCERGQSTRGWPKHSVGARVRYFPLSKLLTTDYPGDAHFGAYSVPHIERRLTTAPAAYERIESGIPMVGFYADLDCGASHRSMGGSEKVPADDAWWESQRPLIESLLLAHPGGYVFRTRGGGRIVYRLPAPHVIRNGQDEHAWKRLYLGLLAMLARRFSIVCDPAINDWTRIHRLPRIVRDGKPQRYETIGDPYRVGAIDYQPDATDLALDLDCARELAKTLRPWRAAVRILEGPLTLGATRTPRKPRAVTPRQYAETVYQSLAEDVGRALRGMHGRHGIHLAIAGACYARGVPLERGPDLARAITVVTGETDDRPQVWQTTADRILRGLPVAGHATLQSLAPEIAAVIDTALPRDGGAQAVRDALDSIGIPTEHAAVDVAAKIHDAMVDAPLGFSVLRVTEGAGKTRAAADVAIERARAAPPGRLLSRDRTLIVTDKHNVAANLFSRIREAGVHVEYWRSVLSVENPDGTKACEYHVSVAALASGRQSAVATFCDGIGMGHKADAPCPQRPVCPAYRNAVVSANAPPESTEQPRVVITVHAKLGEALGWAGESALVLIDEDPKAIEAHTLTREQLDAIAAFDGAFASHERWRTVVARALAAGLSNAVPGEKATDTLRRGCEILERVGEWRDAAEHHFQTTDSEAIGYAFAIRAAYRKTADGRWKRKPSFAPRLHPRERARVFARGSIPDDIGKASLVHAVLGQAFAGAVKAVPEGASLHRENAMLIVDRGDTPDSPPVLRAILVSAPVEEAMHRYGQTVLLDATANIMALEAVAEREIPETSIRVADGSPIERRLLYYSDATRAKTIERSGSIRWDGIERYIREAIAWLMERLPIAAGAVALFTWMQLADVFRTAWSTPSKADPVAVSLLQPLRTRRTTLNVGHYGAVRGSDEWSDCDGYISIGDPRQNVGSAFAIAAAISLGDERDVVYRHATAAESSQTAGRVRAPWRSKRAAHIHVGTIPPLSWDARADVVEIPHGVREVVDVSQAVRVYGSKRVAASALAVDRRTVQRSIRNDSEGVEGAACLPIRDDVDRETCRNHQAIDNTEEFIVQREQRDSGMFGSAFEGDLDGTDPDDEWRV